MPLEGVPGYPWTVVCIQYLYTSRHPLLQQELLITTQVSVLNRPVRPGSRRTGTGRHRPSESGRGRTDGTAGN